MALWYRRRFNLTPYDPLFLNLTELDVVTEYLAHQYDDAILQGKPIEDFSDPDFDAEMERFMADDNPDHWEDVP